MSDVYLDIGKIVLVHPKTQQMYCYVNSLKRIMPCYSLERFFFNRRNAFCVSRIKGLTGMNVIVVIVKHLQACWLIGVFENNEIPNEQELRNIVFNQEITKEKYLEGRYYYHYTNNLLLPHAGLSFFPGTPSYTLAPYQKRSFYKSIYLNNNKISVGPTTAIPPNLSQLSWSSGLEFHQIGYNYDKSFINIHFETKYDQKSNEYKYTFTYEKLKSIPFHIIVKFKHPVALNDKCPSIRGEAEFVSASYQYIKDNKLINLRLYSVTDNYSKLNPIRIYFGINTHQNPFFTYTRMCWYQMKQQLLQPMRPASIVCQREYTRQEKPDCMSIDIFLPESEFGFFVTNLGEDLNFQKHFKVINYYTVIENNFYTNATMLATLIDLLSTVYYPQDLAGILIELSKDALPRLFYVPKNIIFSISNINALIQQLIIKSGLYIQEHQRAIFYM
ncbi:MAG: hypothetical protein QXH92_04105 [Candidatus Aenigmatarchaeota archaeon]